MLLLQNSLAINFPVLVLQDASWGYKTFFYDSSKSEHRNKAAYDGKAGQISLRLSSNMLEGSTGCFQWEAGFLLGAFILSNPHLFSGK